MHSTIELMIDNVRSGGYYRSRDSRARRGNVYTRNSGGGGYVFLVRNSRRLVIVMLWFINHRLFIISDRQHDTFHIDIENDDELLFIIYIPTRIYKTRI